MVIKTSIFKMAVNRRQHKSFWGDEPLKAARSCHIVWQALMPFILYFIYYHLYAYRLGARVWEQQKCRPACAPTQSAPLLFSSWKVSYLSLLQGKFRFSSKSLRLSRLVLGLLVRNPEDRFSCFGTQLLSLYISTFT